MYWKAQHPHILNFRHILEHLDHKAKNAWTTCMTKTGQRMNQRILNYKA